MSQSDHEESYASGFSDGTEYGTDLSKDTIAELNSEITDLISDRDMYQSDLDEAKWDIRRLEDIETDLESELGNVRCYNTDLESDKNDLQDQIDANETVIEGLEEIEYNRDEILNILETDYPEVLADLVLKGLVK